MELLKVDTIDQARDKLLKAAGPDFIQTEYADLEQALGRILAEDLVSPEAVPDFRRSTVDGYAVKAANTQGVTDSVPVFLKVIEKVEIGAPATKTIEPGQCTYVPTGGMVPEGADAMVMIEHCERFDEDSIAVYEPVSPGRNVVAIGEDIEQGDLFLAKGTKLRPQEMGALAAVGATKIQVYKPWTVTILSTGDELVAPNAKPQPGQIRDINTYAIRSLALKHGFEIIDKKIIKDREEDLRDAVTEAVSKSDLVVLSGGSSQGEKDYTAKILDEIGTPGVFTHGIALKPGKPTILGYDQKTQTILMGLPGHPAAAMMVFELLAGWLFRQVTNQAEPLQITATMESNAPGAPGRTTCLLVELVRQDSQYLARPIFGKSGLITTLTRAHGYTLIDMNREGLKAGEEINVYLI